jgi:N-terminal domain of anti-restriction factor ArdC
MERKRYDGTDPHERVDDALARLEAGIYATFDQDDFRHFLAAQALFHDYSARNVMLILAQKREASRCASFETWKKLGRWVKKGEKSIAVRVPIVSTIEREDPETGEVSVAELLRGFRLGHVFDVLSRDC